LSQKTLSLSATKLKGFFDRAFFRELLSNTIKREGRIIKRKDRQNNHNGR